ncbi:hypothetical protein CEXT_38151 [Caerostris extrusa]|uniref:Uncharacterized protein n=1 Tax=Caerostris extrusa TaxID=172846 RepID=A0AAV4NUW3_CAEEX|nr:hypothetical protein CEXT_38151 [Caerostris extrusa]
MFFVQIYHLIGSLLSTNGSKFLQVNFIADYAEKANAREQHISNLGFGVIDGLQRILPGVNPYIKTALEFVAEGQYNAALTNKVALLLVDQERDDIALRMHDDRLQGI